MKNNLVLIGMPGCGKSTVGKMVADRIGRDFYDIDECIESKEGMSISHIFQSGEEYFRKVETDVLEEICRNENSVISTGGGVIKREYNIEIMKKSGVIIFIDRKVEDIIKDVNVENRPLLKSGVENLYSIYQERYEQYRKYCDYMVDNCGNIDYIVDNIIKILTIDRG